MFIPGIINIDIVQPQEATILTGQPTNVVFLNGHIVELPSKNLCLNA